MQPRHSAHVPIHRRSRPRESGLTLIELLVTIVILAAIGGSIGGAFTIGLHTLSSGGPTSAIIGDHDIIAVEQQLGADIARAVCLASPGPPAQTSLPSGGCTGSVQKSPSTCGAVYSVGNPTGYLLCLAWYIPGSASCHTVTYWQLGTALERSDSATSTTSRLSGSGLSLVASWTTFSTANGYSWTKLVKIVATQQGSGTPSKPATATFYATPLVEDPRSPLIPTGTTTC